MITAVLFVPAAPWLIPSVAPTLSAEQAELRRGIDRLVEASWVPRRAALGVGSSHSRARWDVDLPLELGPDPYRGGAGTDAGPPGHYWVARALLGPVPLDAGALPLVHPQAETDAPDPVPPALAALEAGGQHCALLVTADGSTAHGEHAPRAPDARAANYDAALHAALAGGPGSSRAWLDSAAGSAELAAELGATLPTALRVVVDTLAAAGDGWDVIARDVTAPYGVGHHVVRWGRR